jgi:hypothetical protein
MKILILVLSINDQNIYSQFYKTQKETWDTLNVKDIKTIYYFANSEKNFIYNENIYTNIKEGYLNIGYKTLTAFELIKNLEFDYIFRTTSSSYVDKKLLMEFIVNKPKDKFYSGITVSYGQLLFASGCGYFLSRDLFEYILENKNEWNHNVIDDVSLGIMMQGYAKIYEGERFDLSTPTFTPRRIVFPKSFDAYPESLDYINPNYYHYRYKTENRLTDIENMKKTHAIKKDIENLKKCMQLKNEII